MTKKEKILEQIKNPNKIIWMGDPFSAFPDSEMIFDPISANDFFLDYDENYLGIDGWGSTWRNAPGDPGAVPICTEDKVVIKDIENWKDDLKVPDISNLDWSKTKEQVENIDRDKYLIMVPTFYGPFERLHILVGFEEALMALYTEPEIINEIMEVLTDYKIEVCKLLIDNLKPDIIHSHDDWGDATKTFMSPEVFRNVLKPHYERLYSYIKSRGVLIQHHSDGVCLGLEKDMIDLGIDMWQGVIPSNNIPEVQKNIDGKMLLLGGIDQLKFDVKDFDEDLIRAEVRNAINQYGPGGGFLPDIASVHFRFSRS